VTGTEALKFHVDNWQCRQILLGCCYDSGYTPFLGQFAADARLSNRIALLQGGLPSSKAKSDFKTVRFDNLFTGKHHPSKQNGKQSPKQVNGVASGPKTPGSGPPWVYRFAARERFGPVLRDEQGKRIDKILSISPEVAQRFEKRKMCYWFYLRGSCTESQCQNRHEQTPLTNEEWDAVWWLSRKGHCYKAKRSNGFCENAMCTYSHG
jgi:hypothetical protein